MLDPNYFIVKYQIVLPGEDFIVKYRLPKGTIRSGSSVKSSSRTTSRSRSNSASSSARDDARLTDSASSSARDDAGPYCQVSSPDYYCQVSSPEGDDTFLAQVSNRPPGRRVALGLIAHRPLRETMLDPTVKYRLTKGTIRYCQVSSPEGDDTFLAQVSNRPPGRRVALGLIAHRPLRETMLD